MDVLKFGQRACDFFDSTAPKNIMWGYEKYILTDGQDCVIVRSDHKPEPGKMIFLCSIKNGIACAELYRKSRIENAAA